MNTKLASRFTAVAIATTAVFGIAASSASAATLTCNAANKGRVVKTKVCSFEKGRYAWLNVVPKAPATPPATEPAPIKGVTFSPVDGSFTATILPTWEISTRTPTYVIAYPAGQSATSPSFTAHTFDYAPDGTDAEQEMNKEADEVVKNGQRSVTAREVVTIKGRKIARYASHQLDDPETRYISVFIYTRDGKSLVKVDGSYIRSKANSERHRGEINQMISAMLVR
jgi:hypothetical protein